MSKLEKLKIELARAKKKSGEWQARVRDIEKQITDCENTEILQAVRSIAASPEELACARQTADTLTVLLKEE